MDWHSYLFNGRTVAECPFTTNGQMTLRYPEPDKEDRAEYRRLLKEGIKSDLDVYSWGQLRIYLIQPDWLMNSQKRNQRKRLVKYITQEFADNMLKEYSPLQIFQETPAHQESAFITAIALLTYGYSQFAEKLVKEIKKHPSSWGFSIQMAGWLLDELQLEVDEGPVYELLEEVRHLEYQEEATLEEQVSLWLGKFIGSVSANLPDSEQ